MAQFIKIASLGVRLARDDAAVFVPRDAPHFFVFDFGEQFLCQDALGQPIHIKGMILESP
jgi:hypothetical protein